jgi:tetratricopeptide (TPR) repeat protein
MLHVVEWSWKLLRPAQAKLLADLTVFHGGFTVRAAGSVCGLTAVAAGIALDELLAHSLLYTSQTDGSGQRFSLFEPIREYAAGQIDDADAPTLRARHRAWFTAWGQGLPPTPPLAELRAEMPNLRAALASALADGVPEQAVQLALPLHRALEDIELPGEALALLESAVLGCADGALRSRGHSLLGPMLFSCGRGADALRHAELGLCDAPAEPALHAQALHALARVRWRTTRDAIGLPAVLDQALALAVATGEIEVQAGVHALRGFIATAQGGDPAGAEALHAHALALWEMRGNQHAIDSGRYNLAATAQSAGRNAEALERLTEIIDSARQLQDWRRLSQSLNVRGNALSALRRWGEAVATYRECIQLAWDGMAAQDLAYGLWNLPRALAHRRQPRAALQLAAFAAHFWETRFGVLGAADLHYLRLVRRLAALRIDAADSARLWAAGRRLSIADAVALALQASSEAA